MIEFLSSLDNREIATAFWLAILLAWCLSMATIRGGILSLLRAASAKAIVVSFTLAIAYIAVITSLLHRMDLWTIRQLKITILWFALAGIPSLVDTPTASKNPSHLRTSAAKNFKLSLFLDFFINLYKLPLIAELIFVPFTALLGGMLAVSQRDEKYAAVHRLLNRTLVFTGLTLLAFETYKLATSFKSIATLDTVRDFSLPLIYSVAFIPILWMMAIYAAYESAFLRLRYLIEDQSLRAYARRRLILTFRTNLTALNEWRIGSWSGELNSRQSIARSINERAAQ